MENSLLCDSKLINQNPLKQENSILFNNDTKYKGTCRIFLKDHASRESAPIFYIPDTGIFFFLKFNAAY